VDTGLSLDTYIITEYQVLSLNTCIISTMTIDDPHHNHDRVEIKECFIADRQQIVPVKEF